MNSILRVQSIRKFFPVASGLWSGSSSSWIRAVDDVSFEIHANETFGIVGESGCGKTTLARTILRLTEPTSGSIFLEDEDITKLGSKELKPHRRQMQMVFQDPYTALHPRKRAREIIGEPLEIHGPHSRTEMRQRVAEMVKLVGLSEEQMQRYPHEFSGGQRQRIMIARALILKPPFLVLDEPTSALDVSVQALILNLLKQLQKDQNLTYLLISHHLSVVEFMSDRIAVMYLGKIVEIGLKEDLFSQPRHPYTQALLSAIPRVPGEEDGEANAKRIVLPGEVPSSVNPPSGCRFHTRCPYAQQRCKDEEPLLREAGKNRMVACHFWENISSVIFKVDQASSVDAASPPGDGQTW